MEIRLIKREELPACAALIRESFQTVADQLGFTPENAPRFTAFATTPERLTAQYEDPRREMYVGEEGGHAVGYFSLLLLDGGACVLNNLCVRPSRRHGGIGRALASFALRRAQELQCGQMRLGIVEENKALRAWYESLGFAHVGTKKFDFFPFTCGYMEQNL